MVVHLESPDNRYDMLYLANLAILQVKDELGRLPGVGNVQVFGAGDFSMRVWLNPNQLASHNLTATDVVQAIREQNVQVAAGVLGAPPTNTGSTAFQLLVNTQDASRRRRIQQHHRARRERRPNHAHPRCRPSGIGFQHLRSAKPLGQQTSGGSTNLAAPRLKRAANVATGARHDGAAQKIVPGRRGLHDRYDPTVFVRESIQAVGHTFVEALILVVLVVLVFLQTWRASIIPLLALQSL